MEEDEEVAHGAGPGEVGHCRQRAQYMCRLCMCTGMRRRGRLVLPAPRIEVQDQRGIQWGTERLQEGRRQVL